MKQCRKCKNWKALDEFYRHAGMADGRLNKCIECTKADVTENRAAKADYYRRYDAARAKLPHRKELSADGLRLWRFRKRKAKERAAGIFGNESGSRARY